MHRLPFATSAAGALLLVGACNAFNSSFLPAGDGGPNPNGRGPIVEPSRPAESTNGPNVEDRLFALHQVVLLQRDALNPNDCDEGAGCLADKFGVNLDGLLTSPSNQTGECRASLALTLPTDGLRGIDNAFGKFFYPSAHEILEFMGGDFEEEARVSHDAGRGTTLILVRNWDGDGFDAHVTTITMQAVDATSADPTTVHWGIPDVACTDPVGSPPNLPQLLNDSDNCPAPDPLWDGTSDHFWVRRDNFAAFDLNRPFNIDNDAYVASDVLVSRLPEGTQFLFFAGSRGNRVQFGTGYAIHPFDLTSSYTRMQNVAIAGRYPTNVIIGAAPHVGVCPSDCVTPGDITDQSCSYNLLIQALDTYADVLAAPDFSAPLDLEGPPCDALSMATLFQEGLMASFEGIAPVTPEELPIVCQD